MVNDDKLLSHSGNYIIKTNDIRSKELTEILLKVRQKIDDFEKKREKILFLERNIIQNCSEIIKKIHRDEKEEIPAMIERTSKLIHESEKTAGELTEFLGKNYFTNAKQEFTEAVFLYKFVYGEKLPSPEDLGVNAYEYILGLADVVGELKRLILDQIKRDNFKDIDKIFLFMDELYQDLFSLDYPSGLLPGFRKKVDIDRRLVGTTLENITLTKKISQLNKRLSKINLFKENKENK
ncbi:MAG: hypothetical protein ACTSU2_02635 [Promethearchaeota archaeon]